MVRKIIFPIVSITILYLGYNSFNRLSYWDRSVQIFKVNNNQAFGRGFDRGRESFNGNNIRERSARFDFGNIPDSVRQQFEQQRRRTQRQISEQPQIPAQPQNPNQPEEADMLQIPERADSLSQQNRIVNPPVSRSNFRGRGGFKGGGRQRDGFQRGRNVRLNTVYHFLAVFAALTALTIYIDK